jgi:hypothetical protein
LDGPRFIIRNVFGKIFGPLFPNFLLILPSFKKTDNITMPGKPQILIDRAL